VAIVELRAFLRVSDLERRGQQADPLEFVQVGRAGEDDVILFTVEQAAQHQAVSVGVGHHFGHFSSHDLLAVPGQTADVSGGAAGLGEGQPDYADLLHFHAGHGHQVRQPRDRYIDLNKIS